jgi:hypothetical protein
MLAGPELESFVHDGFVVLRGAVGPEVMGACAEQVDDQLRQLGIDPQDPATWRSPVVRLDRIASPAALAAGTEPRLLTACGQLLGSNAWAHPIAMGTVPVRFPHADDPGDAGWHVDAGFVAGGSYRANLASRGRGLLALFLVTDVGIDDAPTELKVGSHLDVPSILAPAGDAGVDFMAIAAALPPTTFARPSRFATGAAGDVYLCHPFLVHRATWPHRGERPRAIAQPAVLLRHPLALTEPPASPVEAAILLGLAAGAPTRSSSTPR